MVLGPFFGPLARVQVWNKTRPRTMIRAFFRALEIPPRDVILAVFGRSPGLQYLDFRGTAIPNIEVVDLARSTFRWPSRVMRQEPKWSGCWSCPADASRTSPQLTLSAGDVGAGSSAREVNERGFRPRCSCVVRCVWLRSCRSLGQGKEPPGASAERAESQML